MSEGNRHGEIGYLGENNYLLFDAVWRLWQRTQNPSPHDATH